jgi:fumarylacetoacetase
MASSWIGVEADSDFSLANLPFGIISTVQDPSPRIGVAIGDVVLDLKTLSTHEGFAEVFPCLKGHENVFQQSSLNAFAALGRRAHREVRETLQEILSDKTQRPQFLKDNAQMREDVLIPQSRAKNHLPMEIGDYTDFYAGYHHAFAVGSMFRGPENALQPNYTHLPVGYHGRASSIIVSRTSICRPWGQILLDPTAETKQPMTAPSRKLDIEVELGCFIATPNKMGNPVPVESAEEHIFGYVLLNDWSARDIQTWEYVPLGPFNGKNFATTISPWVVLADALEPFRAEGIKNTAGLQPYLEDKKEQPVFDIELQVDLTSTFHHSIQRNV